MIWIFCSTSIDLIGCTTERTIPEWHAHDFEAVATDPDPRCTWPDPERDGDRVYYSASQFAALVDCQVAEKSNHDIAAKNAESIRALLERLNAIDDIGEQQREMAIFQLNELERDRRDAAIEAWIYKGLFALGLVATIL